ncbi:MAG: UDP-N-acetylmuramoyl-L-alanyl-D-glutamate--2,6-diaminopimelate ligase, partial [Gemmatimonadetes bacterium]|nr:UDP-N-acetylmuramoyl-L-alanyl-D-glutamate--2,6-diaminopimelate ligase [Gemmatimonadota bacterium]NIQ58547.1 UDP-N-acetylmuramoyl-L-alanyl-D-glutamate--2,6-diaminopimelate ligase [Gemmatimonadota bacterium]NIU78741.1 UDP-N-acetylmuramoyl-L-alanyl-D-glutamate--2,6-diaminopimelate ligase [Gammaproteobacteria bacterium]NIX47555.1 UDP-N-acetylmuramoyl-L-alanyl-D-glutamate--2,6-diaminopimelate ligase [Gemmatimonadota bacterium]NIY11926.1 UDP-N-acetylmuramoyl-L-alanyl-D-glutamate--2,6-diaminopimela
GLELEEVVNGLADAPQVPGRLEQVMDDPFRVVIDYAHTPDALERVLATLRHITDGRVIV